MSHLRAGSAMIDLVQADAGSGRNMDHFCLRILERHGVAVGDIRERYGAEGNGISRSTSTIPREISSS
jgi:hypothetical protein